MQNLHNGYTVTEINQYREALIDDAKMDIEECKALGLEDMISTYKERIEELSYMTVADVARAMVY